MSNFDKNYEVLTMSEEESCYIEALFGSLVQPSYPLLEYVSIYNGEISLTKKGGNYLLSSSEWKNHLRSPVLQMLANHCVVLKEGIFFC